jgi:hypothetical protein
VTAVDIRIGDTWHFGVSDYNVVGDSTGTVVGDMTGGAGTMSVDLPETADSKLLSGRPVLLRDTHMGETSGILRTGSGNGVNATTTAVSRIALLNVNRTATAFTGTLRAALLYYFGLAGITTNIVIESNLASRAVNFPGWQGNVLDYLKDLCVAQRMELSLIGEKYVVRPIRRRTLDLSSAAEPSWSTDESALAQSVEVLWHETTPIQNGLVYPAGGWSEEVTPLQVDEGELVEIELTLGPEDDEGQGVSAVTVDQPVCVASVSRTHSTSSVYSVSGKDGLPVTPAQWNASGGRLTVALKDGGSTLVVTIQGPRGVENGPYAIAMASGTSDQYSSLRVYGSRMYYKRHLLTMQTGLSEDVASQESAPRAESSFINSYEQAWRAASNLLAQHAGAQMSVTVQLGVIEGSTIAHSFFGGDTVTEDLAAHPFGNVEGARLRHDGTMFRARSVSSSASISTVSATQDTISQDLATEFGTLTASQWNARLPAGMTASQFNARQMNG